MTDVPRVVRNDWSRVAVADLDGWQPTQAVSVIIPAFECQRTLDLTLASLSRQTYPAELLEVIVVDDGSDPPLRLPRIRPERTRLVRAAEGWGKASALREGVAGSSGEILHLLDADMLLYPEHVAAHARWHHALPYAVTLGHKRFIDGVEWPSPEQVMQTPAERLFGGQGGQAHEYQERYIAQTDQLRAADHLAFRIFVGATVGLRRELYDLAGGPDPGLRLGEDTELGYRLAQAGGVFVPEPAARSWHLGPTHVMRAQEQIARHRQAFIADLVPMPRHWRRAGGTTWTVPLVQVTLPVGDAPLETVRAAVDSILRGAERDLRIDLVGPWDRLDTARVPALSDPQLEPRLIAATYRGEPRVRLVTQAPRTAFPSPYGLDLPGPYVLAPDALGDLVALADRHQAGVVRVDVPDGEPALLWRTAALARARWVAEPGEPLLDAVAAVYGRHDTTAAQVGLGADGPRRRGMLVPTMVEVEGVRSLARATVVVGWLAYRRGSAWLRRMADWALRRAQDGR